MLKPLKSLVWAAAVIMGATACILFPLIDIVWMFGETGGGVFVWAIISAVLLLLLLVMTDIVP